MWGWHKGPKACILYALSLWSSTVQLDWHWCHWPSAIGALFTTQKKAGSHWAHVVGMKESGDAMVKAILWHCQAWFGGLLMVWGGISLEASISRPTVPHCSKVLGWNLESDWQTFGWCSGFLFGARQSAVSYGLSVKASLGWWMNWCQWLSLTFSWPKSNWVPLGYYVSCGTTKYHHWLFRGSQIPWIRSGRRSKGHHPPNHQ